MKKTFLRIAIFAFVLGGLSFVDATYQVKAQNALSSDLFVEPTNQFVSAPDAVVRINQEITSMKYVLAGLVEGTPEYRTVWLRSTFYSATLEGLNAGKTVPQSIVEGLKYMTQSDDLDTGKGVLFQYRTQMISLLKV